MKGGQQLRFRDLDSFVNVRSQSSLHRVKSCLQSSFNAIDARSETTLKLRERLL